MLAGVLVAPEPNVRPRVPVEVAVKRSDPVYNAHAYLTKIPVTAIVPFIEAFTEPGDVVLDLFAGSGMTGVAAAIAGRRAVLRDIAVLGRHIGRGYVDLVDGTRLRAAGRRAIERAQWRLGYPYRVACRACGGPGELSRTTWSVVFACARCEHPVNFYDAFRATGWVKRGLRCPHCDEPVDTRRAERRGETPVLDTVACPCARTLRDQPPAPPAFVPPHDLTPPAQPIGPERQMFQASALGKHGLRSTADFFSPRNLYSLEALRQEILALGDERLTHKLLFAFTAILTRASKRYQWHPKRPLNASNANYYIAPVYYEWNVFDLFARKLEAVRRADDEIRRGRAARSVTGPIEVDYEVGSADALDVEDAGVDYVFCDPPFGSNIFYSDMNLFQEAWLQEITDHDREVVVDRSGARTAERYERLLTGALREAHRVLKPGGWVSMNFSNSSGALWALGERAIREAGFVLDSEAISVLDKGQRSVKELASGFENIVTADLVLSMRKGDAAARTHTFAQAPPGALGRAVDDALGAVPAPTPTRIYLEVVRAFLWHGWDAGDLNIAALGPELRARGYEVHPGSGRLHRACELSPSRITHNSLSVRRPAL